MPRIDFVKMEGAGNDFVVIDARGGAPWLEDAPRCARSWCDRRRGVGADGVLLLLDPPAAPAAPEGSAPVLPPAGRAGAETAPPSPRPAFLLRYLNADGSVGEFCGNGARSAALFAARRGIMAAADAFATDSGLVTATVDLAAGRVRLRLPPVRLLRDDLSLAVGGREVRGSLWRVGVPHFVVAVEDEAALDRLDVEVVGRALRGDPAFAEVGGANVDFVAPPAEEDGRSHRRLRTYERGVEAETLACGSGAVAAAAAAAAACAAVPRGAPAISMEGAPLGARQTLHLLPASGDLLSVSLRCAGRGIMEEVELEGPAREVFWGQVVWEG